MSQKNREDLIMNEQKTLHMNQILEVMHYEWTQAYGPGNGPWVFSSCRIGVAGGGEWQAGKKQRNLELSIHTNGNHITLPGFSSRSNNSKDFHLPNPEWPGSTISFPRHVCLNNQACSLPLLDLKIPYAIKKPCYVTFTMVSSASHSCHHSVISECHRQFSAPGKWKRGMEGEVERWPR